MVTVQLFKLKLLRKLEVNYALLVDTLVTEVFPNECVALLH